MPGIGVRTCAGILTEVTGKHLASAAHLASWAGIAQVARRSGTSIRADHTSRRGNKKLKRALFLSAFAALDHLPSRACYDRKAPKEITYIDLGAFRKRVCSTSLGTCLDYAAELTADTGPGGHG
jgi:transposase